MPFGSLKDPKTEQILKVLKINCNLIKKVKGFTYCDEERLCISQQIQDRQKSK